MPSLCKHRLAHAEIQRSCSTACSWIWHSSAVRAAPRGRALTLAGAWGRGSSKAPEVQLSVAPPDPLHPISGVALQPRQCMVPTLASLAAALVLAGLLLTKRERKAAVKEEPDADLLPSSNYGASDPMHHQRVIAKTRQAAHISSAVAYNRAGEVAKAVLELNKALAANSICRAPALVTHTKEELAALYRLHMMNTEQPPSFATLLQLQEMLGISQEEADRIEVAVLHSPGAFAI